MWVSFGFMTSLKVALRVEAVRWSNAYGIHHPVPLCRLGYHGSKLQANKLHLMIELQLHGWIPGRPAAPAAHDSVDFVFLMGKSVAYYACLLECEMIWAKGVVNIPHDKTDGFYKCLLQFDGAKLQQMLANGEDKPHAWYMLQLKDEVCVNDEEVPDDDYALALPAGPDLALALPGVPEVPERVDLAQMGWTRKIVHIGEGSERLKVLFDNSSHASGEKRGWVDCALHPCIRYRHAKHAHTQRFFCSEMYQWHLDRTLEVCSTKQCHLNHKPDPVAVDNIESLLVMEDF